MSRTNGANEHEQGEECFRSCSCQFLYRPFRSIGPIRVLPTLVRSSCSICSNGGRSATALVPKAKARARADIRPQAHTLEHCALYRAKLVLLTSCLRALASAVAAAAALQSRPSRPTQNYSPLALLPSSAVSISSLAVVRCSDTTFGRCGLAGLESQRHKGAANLLSLLLLYLFPL